MKRISLISTLISLFGVVPSSLLIATLADLPSFGQAQLPQKPSWELAPTEPLERPLQWTAVEQYGAIPPQFQPVPAKVSPEELAAKPRVEGPYRSRGIYGVGGGIRAGNYTGDTTAGVVTARVGYKLDETFSVSLRPTGIFGPDPNNNNNDDDDDNDNSGFELRLPLTLDIFHNGFITPFVGGGIATNVDNLGYTDGMLTGGVDINLTKWITVSLNVNYIYQTNINDTDKEALGMLYLRF
ncbi:MAG: hypothetical protein ACK6BM_00850 [Cyanobacteriota bacterium]|jgi:hypothetical protein